MSSHSLACEYLRSADIEVTNQSDKIDQLAKLKTLDDRVKGLFVRDAAMTKVEEASIAEIPSLDCRATISLPCSLITMGEVQFAPLGRSFFHRVDPLARSRPKVKESASFST